MWPSDIPGVFNAAGYSNQGNLVDFNTNQSLVQSDLNQGYPVALSGKTCDTCFGTWHIWVCDGFHLDTFYDLNCDGYSPVCQESAFLFYSLRWGQGGNYDGWFGVGGFAMGGDVYDTSLKANIQARP